MNVKYKLYCDLDGVLVDFSKGYYDLTGIDLTGIFRKDKKFWGPIDKAGKKFWANLKWMKDGKELWDYIKKYNPDILSAPSRENDSRVGKNEWVNREIPGAHLILRSMEHKKEFASPDAILIDDNEDNIKDWKDAGGITIHHTSTKETIKQLKKLGL